MSQYIQVVETETEEPTEIPSEEDGSLLLSTLSAQFPGACGLKYRNPDTGNFRGVRLNEGYLFPPDGEWGSTVYVVVFPKLDAKQSEDQQTYAIQSLCDNKRKGDGELENPAAKTKRFEKKPSDLIILGLPWKSTEDDVKKYFSQFGEVILSQVKRDPKTGQSKGYGFVRFAEYDSQTKCLGQRHMIDGRWCDVNIPNSVDGGGSVMNRKIFIARCSEDITADDLRNYFGKYGEITDVFIPRPFRAFAFVTFSDAAVAQGLCGEDHIINGTSVHISSAAPKSHDRQEDRYSRRSGGGYSSGYDRSPPRRGERGGDWDRGSSHRGNLRDVSRDGNGMPPGGPDSQMGMNLLNSAVMAAAQAMLTGQGGWGQMMQGQGSGDHSSLQSYSSMGGSRSDTTNRGFGGWGSGYDTSSSGYSGWGQTNTSGSNTGSRGGWN